MSGTFNIGDLVQLKSGGPVMTVTGSTDEEVEVAWFAGSMPYDRAFPLAALKPAKPQCFGIPGVAGTP